MLGLSNNRQEDDKKVYKFSSYELEVLLRSLNSHKTVMYRFSAWLRENGLGDKVQPELYRTLRLEQKIKRFIKINEKERRK